MIVISRWWTTGCFSNNKFSRAVNDHQQGQKAQQWFCLHLTARHLMQSTWFRATKAVAPMTMWCCTQITEIETTKKVVPKTAMRCCVNITVTETTTKASVLHTAELKTTDKISISSPADFIVNESLRRCLHWGESRSITNRNTFIAKKTR